jgi:adenylate cyclase
MLMVRQAGDDAEPRLGMYQRMVVRNVHRRAKKARGEPLSQEDWAAWFEMAKSRPARAMRWLWRTLPSSPRCGMCSAPFAGPGRFVVRPLGFRPSRKNPTICATCVEASPPGGTTLYTGVLFADLRGFTSRTETTDAADVAWLLRRFYGCAERVLFPEAIIDKVVGDQVMALYLPDLQHGLAPDHVPELMLEHAFALLRAVGYRSADGPFTEVGIGLDIGEAFVGNIGERAVYDFTAVGDVVNTAARLESEARGGEILLSDRVAAGLRHPPGTLCDLQLKGKQQAQRCHRASIRTT